MVHQMPSAIAGSATPHSSHSMIDARYWRSTSQALRISAPYRLITRLPPHRARTRAGSRSEEHTSELQSRLHLVCRLLLEKKKNRTISVRVRLSRDEAMCCGEWAP